MDRRRKSKLIIRGENLLKLGRGASNTHQLAMASRVSYSTVHKYVLNPQEIKAVDLFVVFAILTDGLGLTPEQVLEMRFGDVFELSPED